MRLGREKALEQIGQQSLIERVIDCLYPLSQTVLVVTSREKFDIIASACLNGKVIVDLCPGKAALGGIYTGLMNANTLYSVVVGCDMPFLNHRLMQHLVNLSADFDAVVPRLGGMIEPLHAVYSKKCLGPVEYLLCQDALGVSQLFDLVRTKYVDDAELGEFDPEYRSFFNINTRNDLRKARSLMRSMRKIVNDGKADSGSD